MTNDAIVEEVHRIREAMWDAAGGDLNRLIQTLRAAESTGDRKVLTREQVESLRQAQLARGQAAQSRQR